MTRVSGAALVLALAGAAPAVAQIPGMPLFTNPRFATGIRVHVDGGMPTGSDPHGDLTVVQGGASIVLGPLAIGAAVGTTSATVKSANTCAATPTPACAGGRVTVSALGQLKIKGGGRSNWSLSVFGGGSIDIDSGDANCTGAGCNPALTNKQVNIPVGVALGMRIPLPILSTLNVWGAPRWNMTRFANCSGTCPPNPKGSFGWAVGADMPLFRILSVRAAYDSHKDQITNTTVNVIGAGVSIGLGGMR